MNKKLLIFLLLLPFLLFSQQKKQPKIGLVLSGGGAKGFAHVAILKAIEKAGIKLDYIGGTSMGAIVGSLYAAGYNASQIEEIVLKTNFVDLVQDKIPRKSKPFFEKENGEKDIITLPVDKTGIGLPQGVSRGQSILNFLTKYLAPVDSITDFKKLPIPFFCVATDAENGELVLLENGSLPLVLRASGSFPTLFFPIEINGKLLIDGGIANNFPVDIMRKKGMDIIIGSDVQGALVKKKKLNSVLAILNQVTSYKMYKNNAKQIKNTDFYIHPDITNYSVVSFDKVKEILEKGEEAVILKRNGFDSIARLQNLQYKKPPLKIKSKKFNLQKIDLYGNKNYTRAYILGTLKISVGDTISYDEITEKINNLTATQNFNRIDYAFKTIKGGKKLVLNLEENSQRAYVKLGIHYDNLYKTSVLINYNHKHPFLKNDVLSIDFIVGDNLRYNFDYFIDNGFYWSFGVKSKYKMFNSSINYNQNNISKLNVTYRYFENQMYLQTTFDRKFAVGFGVEHQHIFADSETISNNGNPIVYDKSNYYNGVAFLKLDTYNDKNFMTKGYFANIKYTYHFASSDYNNDFVKFSQIYGKLGFATSFYKKLTFQYESEAGFAFKDVNSQVFDFIIGGYNQNLINNFIPLYGYEIADFTDQTFLKSTFTFRYHLPKKQYLSFIANYARISNNVLKGLDLFKDIKSGYALGYSINTFIGPISLKHSWSPETKNHFWLFNLGFWF